MQCPVCNGRAVGKVGLEQFYCWNCFIEFSTVKEEIRVFEVGEDGSLTAYREEQQDLADTV